MPFPSLGLFIQRDSDTCELMENYETHRETKDTKKKKKKKKDNLLVKYLRKSDIMNTRHCVLINNMSVL